jgi:hypothetical protein
MPLSVKTERHFSFPNRVGAARAMVAYFNKAIVMNAQDEPGVRS